MNTGAESLKDGVKTEIICFGWNNRKDKKNGTK